MTYNPHEHNSRIQSEHHRLCRLAQHERGRMPQGRRKTIPWRKDDWIHHVDERSDGCLRQAGWQEIHSSKPSSV